MDQSNLVKIESSVPKHFSELHTLFRTTAFVFLLSTIISSIWLETVVLDWVISQSSSSEISVYGPYDWVEMRLLSIIILSSLITLPFFSIGFRSFAIQGLLPKERLWLDLYLLLNALLLPIILYWVWFTLIPNYTETSLQLDSISGVNPRYDASEIFSFASGISWVLILTFSSTLFLSISRLFGLVEEGRSRFRNRILAITGGLLILTLPEPFEGLRILIAIVVVAIVEYISRTVPNGPLGLRNPIFPEIVNKDGFRTKVLLMNCSCEGACPSFDKSWINQNISVLDANALCLDDTEQLALRDLISRNSITQLTISGCNGLPLPLDLRNFLSAHNTSLDGLNWLDQLNVDNINWRKTSLQAYSSQFNQVESR